MKQGSGSRQKGSSGELEVVRALRTWWEPVEPGKKWMRSGELGRAPLEFRTHGDVMTDAVRFPFAVEVKRVDAFNYDRWLGGGTSPVWAWWLQACQQARAERAEPMLWFRKNRRPWTVVLPLELVVSLRLPPPLRVFRLGDLATIGRWRVSAAAAWRWEDLGRASPFVFAESA